MNTLRNHFIKSSTGGKPNYTIYYTADLKVPFIGGSQKRGLTMWETGDESEPLATFEVVGDSFANGYGEWGIKTSNPSCFYGLIKDKNGYEYSIDSGNFHTITGLVFPEYDYDNNYITSIGGPLLGDGEGNSLTDVTLPFHLEYLGEDTFKGSVNLQTIIIPPYVETIGNNCFKNCSSLTAFCCEALTPPVLNGLDIFGNFNTIPNLKIYVGFVEDYLQNEDWSKYANIIYLDPCIISYKATAKPYFDESSVTPNSYIHYAYENGKGFMRFSKEVTEINGKLFYSNTSASKISNIYLPNTITSIGELAFLNCSSLSSISIPKNVMSIGYMAFASCSSLTSITIGESVTSIGDKAFFQCSSLTSIVVAEGNTVYDSRENCNAIIETSTNTLILGCKSTVIPNSVTSIGKEAFTECKDLKSIVIPDGVTSIGNYAFSYCSKLTSITIPNSVTSIGSRAFSLSSMLSSITFNGTKAQWQEINLGEDWNNYIYTNVVHCTDGDVTL